MLIQRSVLVLVLPVWVWAQSEDQIRTSQQATQLMAEGRFAQAIPLYQGLVKAMPGNPGLLLNLGMAQHMGGEDRAAVEQFQKVLKLQPQTFPALAMMGASYLRLGQPRSAVTALQKAAAVQPKNADVRRMLADALLAVGRGAEAAAQFHELSTLQPENPHAWYGLGRSYEALAASSFASLMRTAPESAWSLALIAESRIGNNRKSSAFYFYRQALAKNPRLRGAHAGLAAIYRETGHADWAQVEEQREQALGEPDCQRSAAECHYRAGNHQAVIDAARLARTAEAQYWQAKACNVLARDAFRRLASLGQSIPLHRFNAEQHRNEKRHEDAIEELRSALMLKPGDTLLERDLATTVYLAHDYAAAEPMLSKLLESESQAADLHFLLGDTLMHLQQVDHAIPSLRKALALNPKLLPAHGALGRALMQSGAPEKAIPHLQAALSIDEDGSLHYQLMRAAQAAGNSALAAQALRKYQQIQTASEAAKKELERETQITAPEPQ